MTLALHRLHRLLSACDCLFLNPNTYGRRDSNVELRRVGVARRVYTECATSLRRLPTDLTEKLKTGHVESS